MERQAEMEGERRLLEALEPIKCSVNAFHQAMKAAKQFEDLCKAFENKLAELEHWWLWIGSLVLGTGMVNGSVE